MIHETYVHTAVPIGQEIYYPRTCIVRMQNERAHQGILQYILRLRYCSLRMNSSRKVS